MRSYTFLRHGTRSCGRTLDSTRRKAIIHLGVARSLVHHSQYIEVESVHTLFCRDAACLRFFSTSFNSQQIRSIHQHSNARCSRTERRATYGKNIILIFRRENKYGYGKVVHEL